jgi:hypothetical protein
MPKQLNKGDAVNWNTARERPRAKWSRSREPDEDKGPRVKAAAAEPQYIVESDKSGKRAAHGPDELRKR